MSKPLAPNALGQGGRKEERTDIGGVKALARSMDCFVSISRTILNSDLGVEEGKGEKRANTQRGHIRKRSPEIGFHIIIK